MSSRFGIAGDTEVAERLDFALTRHPFNLSRREARRRLAEGNVVLDGRPISIASRTVHVGAHISVVAADADIEVLLAARDRILVNKPDSLPTQPSPGSTNPSLIEVLAVVLRKREEPHELYLVHRLDTNTTGVTLLARERPAAERLSNVISGGDCIKEYLAIVEGKMDSGRVVDAPIGRVSENIFGVVADGKPATSNVTPLATTDELSLLRIRIATGRTHQIRIHLAHIGFPIVGDRKYGSDRTRESAARPLLHAARLQHSSIGDVTAPIPDDFQAFAAAAGLEISGLSGQAKAN
ncbi:MAG TPA: RNA pseudouridine synthase [Thermoanaerobaculia bacterium]|nr:RNA pseudouridine synthase [Thermoanaerobaculia bacterium]